MWEHIWAALTFSIDFAPAHFLKSFWHKNEKARFHTKHCKRHNGSSAFVLVNCFNKPSNQSYQYQAATTLKPDYKLLQSDCGGKRRQCLHQCLVPISALYNIISTNHMEDCHSLQVKSFWEWPAFDMEINLEFFAKVKAIKLHCCPGVGFILDPNDVYNST